jgi:hypothetical protein
MQFPSLSLAASEIGGRGPDDLMHLHEKPSAAVEIFPALQNAPATHAELMAGTSGAGLSDHHIMPFTQNENKVRLADPMSNFSSGIYSDRAYAG